MKTTTASLFPEKKGLDPKKCFQQVATDFQHTEFSGD